VKGDAVELLECLYKRLNGGQVRVYEWNLVIFSQLEGIFIWLCTVEDNKARFEAAHVHDKHG